jgi:hypothetical protein
MKPLNTTDVHTDTDEVPHAQLANLAAMVQAALRSPPASPGQRPAAAAQLVLPTMYRGYRCLGP